MILYHGTAAPLKSIKQYGLKVFNREWFGEFIVSRLKNPREVGPVVMEILSKIREPAFGIYLSTDPEMARDYIGIPEELGFPFIIRPKRVAVEILKALVEVEGDILIGKLVTVEVPDEWKSDPRTHWGYPDEIYIPYDIGPQYIKNIEITTMPWKEVLEGISELWY